MRRIETDPFDCLLSSAINVADRLFGAIDEADETAYEKRQMLVCEIHDAIGDGLEEATGQESPMNGGVSLMWYVDDDDDHDDGREPAA